MEVLEKEARENPFATNPGWDAKDFTSKKIDAFIHGRKIMDTVYKCSHYEHQIKILSVVEGKEQAIFNDISFKYPFREALSGHTGRMCSILTSCYFNLYNELINKGLFFNFQYTLQFFFNFLFHIQLNKENTKFIMPTIEFVAFKNILKKVKSKYPKSPIFTEEWWKRYTEILDALVTLAKTKEWFSNGRKENVSDSLLWERMLGYVKAEQYPYIFYAGFEQGLWEYYPCYVSPNKTITFSNYLEHISLIKNMFLTPDSVENEDIQCDPSSCLEEEAVAEEHSEPAGGRRKKRKSRKLKRKKTQKKRSKPT
jgi:hypothetical protein